MLGVSFPRPLAFASYHLSPLFGRHAGSKEVGTLRLAIDCVSVHAWVETQAGVQGTRVNGRAQYC